MALESFLKGCKYMGDLNVGSAAITKGLDPRRAGNSLDSWLTSLLEKGREGEIRKRPHLYGSDAGFCSRRNVLLANNEWIGNTVNSAGRGYMAIGVAFEDILVRALERAGRFLAGQWAGPELPGLKISSRFDGVILDEQGDVALLEIKTCGRFPDGPEDKPAHLAQVQTYAAISGIRKAYLVYMSRELSPLRPIPIRTFEVDTSDEALSRRLTTAYESVLAEGLPPKPASFRKHTECHYCEFRDHFCWTSRPSRGGVEPEAPLPELTPEAYIRLRSKAEGLAGELIANRDYRLLETLQYLLKKGTGSGDSKKRVAEIHEELEAGLSS